MIASVRFRLLQPPNISLPQIPRHFLLHSLHSYVFPLHSNSHSHFFLYLPLFFFTRFPPQPVHFVCYFHGQLLLYFHPHLFHFSYPSVGHSEFIYLRFKWLLPTLLFENEIVFHGNEHGLRERVLDQYQYLGNCVHVPTPPLTQHVIIS